MKTEMVFETSVSTKAEPHYPADSPKELLHRENIKLYISFTEFIEVSTFFLLKRSGFIIYIYFCLKMILFKKQLMQ